MTAATDVRVDRPAVTARSGMSAATLLRLALAGTRTDAVRIVLTTLGAAAATVGLLATATVLSIQGGNPDQGTKGWSHYTNGLLAQPGLRPGVSVALVLVTLPVLLFVVQCARLGAPARERRLAAFRLAGATPADTARIAALEAGLTSMLGVALGAATYFVGRVIADAPDANGYRPLPTDVLPPAWVIAAVLVAVPVLIVALSLLLLRRVVVSPFGLVRRVRTGRPPLWPGALLIVGTAVLAGNGALLRWLGGQYGAAGGGIALVAVFIALVLVVTGLAFGSAWLSHALGGLLRRFARRPAILLAAARATADPWLGSRTRSVLFLAMLFGAGCALIREGFGTQHRAEQLLARAVADRTNTHADTVPVDAFYARAFDLVDTGIAVVLTIAVAALLLAFVDRILTQRRALASAVAAGIGRRTLAGSVILHTLLTTVPGILVALVVGVLAGRGFAPGADASQPAEQYCSGSDGMQPCFGTAAQHATHVVQVPAQHVYVATPIPWGSLAGLLALAVVAVLVMTAISLLFLRDATRPSELRVE